MRETARSRAYGLIGANENDGGLRRVVSGVTVAAIVVGVVAAILQTVPDLSDAEMATLAALGQAASALLALDWLARLWTAPEMGGDGAARPWAARLDYARSLPGLVDLAVIVPTGLAAAQVSVDPDWLTVGAVGALLKLLRYLPALTLMAAVLRREGRSLLASLVTMGVLLLIVSTLMYVLERQQQPEAFKSIPHTMWWGIVTMATVGYGDMAPQTGLGRVFGGFTMLLGIAMFAVPAGILATGFAEELRKRDFVVTWHSVARVPLFAGFDATRIASIARLLKPQIVPAGSVIVRRGDAADAMFFIMEGQVEVELSPSSVRLKPGQYFGEIALLSGGARTATVTAVSESRLLMLESADFTRLTGDHPDLRKAMEKVAAERAGGE
jgi:voltage-gated potassium channel